MQIENIKGKKKEIKTDKNGFYRFDSLPPGKYEIKVTKKNYYFSERREFSITNKRIKLNNIYLQHIEELKPIIPLVFESFSSDSFDQKWQIESIANLLKQEKSFKKIYINAYSDPCETISNDTMLSYKRGLTIKNLIIAKGIKPKRLIIKSLIGNYYSYSTNKDCTEEEIKERPSNRSVYFSVGK